MKTIGRCIVAGCGSLAIAVAAACSSTPPGAMKCGFHYDDKVLRSVVIPAMRAKLGEGGESPYDLKRPHVYQERGEIVLIFLYSSDDVLDPPRFEMTLNPCSMHVIRAEATTVITPD